MRSPRTALLLLATALVGAGGVVAAPGPVGSAVAGGADVSVTASIVHTHGRTATRIHVRDHRSARVVSRRTVAGAWVLPRPVRGGKLEGISWDGSTLVLQSAERRGRFLVSSSSAGAASIHQIRVPGHVEYDTISVDGRRLFLSEYAPSGEVARIRVYDLWRRTLRAAPVGDKTSSAASMSGVPVARVAAPDGTTVFTVYDGTEYPFVHVLSTDATSSVCIGLPAIGNRRAPGRWTVAYHAKRQQLRIKSVRLGKVFLVDTRNPGARVRVSDA